MAHRLILRIQNLQCSTATCGSCREQYAMAGLVKPQRPDCVAGHVRLELRNVVAKHPFERSHRFAEIQPNSSYRDHSRLSCGLGRCSSGLMPGSRQATEGLGATEAATAAARRIASMPTHGYEATREAARLRSPRAARV